MRRRISVALGMLAVIAAFAGLTALAAKFEGCAESRASAPKPTCKLPVATSPRAVVAALVRRDPTWLLARDDDRGAVVVGGRTSVFVLPPAETREPAWAIAALVAALSPDARTALSRTQPLVVWLGRRAEKTVRYPAWEPALDLELIHDVLTPKGCLARAATADDPEDHENRRRANKHAETAATIRKAIVAALGDELRPLTTDESARRLRDAEAALHSVATVTLRETYAPLSAIVIVGLMLVFYWWAASAGKEDSMFELHDAELRGDGALVAPGKPDLRVLSHGLLHADVKHLLNNAIAIWIGCAILEPAIGSARTLLVFIAGVVAGALVRLRVKRPGLMLGASGGGFALQTAGLVLLLRSGMWFLPAERDGYLIFLGVQLVFGLAASFLPGVSMAAHVGGALAGFAMTLSGLVLIGRPPLDGAPESSVASIIAWCVAAIAILAWVVAGIVVQRGRTDLRAA